jgi:hypothetical protein
MMAVIMIKGIKNNNKKMLQHFIKTLKSHFYLVTAILLIALGFNIGGFAHLSLADTACPSNLSSLSGLGLPAYCNVVGSDSTGLLTHIINILLALLGVIAVLFIIIGGYRMITSSGDTTNFEKGQKTVTYAIIGLVVAVLAFTIITVIGNTLGSATNSNSNSSSSQSSTNNATNSANGNTATAASCASLASAGNITVETTDSNKIQTSTFNQNDQAYLISKSDNPLVSQCDATVTISSSGNDQTYNTLDNSSYQVDVSSLVANGSGSATLTWTYRNPSNNNTVIGTATAQITVDPISGS